MRKLVKDMGYSINVRLPDELSTSLAKMAAATGQTPEEWVVTIIRQQLGCKDDRLRQHFGAVNLGAPTGTNNVQIDAELARAYADDHQEA